MNVLGKELSEKFDHVYSEVVNTTPKPIEFRPLSSLPERELAHEYVKGARRTEDNTVVIYLDIGLANDQFELTAVHELYHELLWTKSIGIKRRVEGISSGLPWANQIAARLANCFVHIAVNRCMKDHGYDITDYDSQSLDNIRRLIRSGDVVNQWDLIIHTIEYISHVYRQKYACPSIDVAKMTSLYNKWHPRIVKFSRRFMAQVGDVDLTIPSICYQATKALRDALGKEYRVDLGSIIKFRNPETGQPE